MYCHWNFSRFNKIAEFWAMQVSVPARTAAERGHSLVRHEDWKRRGREIYDWGGEGLYKEKYGCVAHRVPWFTKSRFGFISKLRGQAKIVFETKQRFQDGGRSRQGRPSWKNGIAGKPSCCEQCQGRFSTYRSRLPSNPPLDGTAVC